jgi:hypothetical protein
MKRFAFTLAALALTGAMAFADDAAPVAKVNGYVNAGLIIASDSDATTYKSHANDFGADGYVSKMTGSLTAANYGVTSTIDLKQVGGVVIDTTYAWVSPIAGFKLEGGSGNDNPLGELDDNGAGAFSSAGLTATYTNSGFTVGAVVGGQTAASKAVDLRAGVRYALDKVVTVNATFGNNAYNTLNWYRVTASVSAVPGLTLTGGYNVADIDYKSAFFDATVGYKISDVLSVGAIVYDKNLTSGTSYFTYKPNASYGLGNGLTLSAYLLGDTQSNPNYEPQVEVDYTLGGATLKTQAFYDTNPGNLATAKARTTLETDFIFSF